MTVNDTLIQLADRYGDFSLKAKRPGRDPGWPKRWRARGAINANRAAEAWGDTPESAIAALVDKIDRELAARRPS